jgi:hypothetical protein
LSIPRYSKVGFAGVARLTRAKYTVFVEGKHHDAVYYERMLNHHAQLASSGVRIIRSYEVSDSDVGTGGKSAVLSLHDYFDESDSLSIPTNEVTKHMLFLLDRDYDEFEDRLRECPHIVYTHATDVEAEIYRLGDLRRALATVFSLTTNETDELLAQIGNFAFELAIRWRQWLTICIAAGPLRSRCSVRPSRPSAINLQVYGQFDAGAYSEHRKALIDTSQVLDPEGKLREITERVDKIYEKGTYFRLIKGKLIPGFLIHLISLSHSIADREHSAKANQLTLTMLETADYAAQSNYYQERFAALETP